MILSFEINGLNEVRVHWYEEHLHTFIYYVHVSIRAVAILYIMLHLTYFTEN